MPSRHPLFRRLGWHPAVAGLCLLTVAGPLALGRTTPGRLAGTAFVGLWFAVALYDYLTGHRWLDRLYDDEPPASDPPGP